MNIIPITKMPSITSLEQLQQVQMPPQDSGSTIPFADILSEAMDTVKETQAISQQDAYNLAIGNMDDLHTMQINSSKATTAMEFTVELTTRAVSAYNEIMRMQV